MEDYFVGPDSENARRSKPGSRKSHRAKAQWFVLQVIIYII